MSCEDQGRKKMRGVCDTVLNFFFYLVVMIATILDLLFGLTRKIRLVLFYAGYFFSLVETPRPWSADLLCCSREWNVMWEKDKIFEMLYWFKVILGGTGISRGDHVNIKNSKIKKDILCKKTICAGISFSWKDCFPKTILLPAISTYRDVYLIRQHAYHFASKLL